MTAAPRPEDSAAVEAAANRDAMRNYDPVALHGPIVAATAKALHDGPNGCEDPFHDVARDMECWELWTDEATAALSAARPHIEAEVRGAVVAECVGVLRELLPTRNLGAFIDALLAELPHETWGHLHGCGYDETGDCLCSTVPARIWEVVNRYSADLLAERMAGGS